MLGFSSLPGFLGLLAFVYLAVCFVFGRAVRDRLLPSADRLFDGVAGIRAVDAREDGGVRSGPRPPAWVFDVPVSFVIGGILVTSVVYLLACAFDAVLPTPSAIHPMLPANLVGVATALLGTRWLRRGSLRPDRQLELSDPGANRFDAFVEDLLRKIQRAWLMFLSSPFYAVTAVLVLLLGLFIMGYVFYGKDGLLYSGVTAFSDFSPHTAMIRSFSHGRNFPTEYPHFADDGIRYHFLFLFFTGNLEFLGLRIDLAFNLLGTLGLVGFCLLLGALGVLLTGRRGVFLLGPMLLFFRASTSFVPFLTGLVKSSAGSAATFFRLLFSQSEFIGDTPFDNWGIWTYNVFGNQRHLLFVASVLLLALFVFVPFVRRQMAAYGEVRHRTRLAPSPEDRQLTTDDLLVSAADAPAEGTGEAVQPPGFFQRAKPVLVALFFRREAWLPRREEIPSLTLVIGLLFLLPYWHGSVLIATLVVLFLLAFFSEARLVYVAAAVLALVGSFLQTGIFAGFGKSVAETSLFFGFVAETRTLAGVADYSFAAFGLTFVLMLLLFFYLRRTQVVLLSSFVMPFVLAFTVSFLPKALSDRAYYYILVNHKFIVLSFAMVNLFIAGLLCDLWASKIPRPLASGLEGPFEAPATTPAEPVAEPEEPPIRSAHPFLPTLLQRSLAVLLGIALMTTGAIDTIIYFNRNKQSVPLQLDSPMVAWIEKHTSTDAVFLTSPSYAYNTFFLAGRMVYFGWPYFAGSAGHDTSARGTESAFLYSGCDGDIEKFRARVKADGISFVIVDDLAREYSEISVNEAFFEKYFPVAATFPDSYDMTIYDVRADPFGLSTVP